MKRIGFTFYIATILIIFAGACAGSGDDIDDSKMQVVVSASILADVVSQVGGEYIQVEVLVPAGSDAHTYQPSPKDLSRISDADVFMIIGLGFESFLAPLLENMDESVKLVAVSGAYPATIVDETGIDPHVWMDPNNVIKWLDPITNALAQIDPDNARVYKGNAASYRTKLAELDTWIKEQVTSIPITKRLIVSDHDVFGYFEQRYDMEIVGAIIPGYSTLAQPSARELSELHDVIKARNIQVIFISEVGNLNLAEQVAEDTETQLVIVYIGGLSGEDGPAVSYLEMMRFNVGVMVEVLG